MIQEANIGVGISGREGLQAARAADYSIASKYLFLLLLEFPTLSFLIPCCHIPIGECTLTCHSNLAHDSYHFLSLL
jgi:hypothetical protein